MNRRWQPSDLALARRRRGRVSPWAAGGLVTLCGLAALGPGPAPAQPADAPAGNGPAGETLSDWRQADHQLLQLAEEYVVITQKQRDLFEQLLRLRGRRRPLEPTDFSPLAIRARRQMSEIFAQYDGLIGQSRDVQERAWKIARWGHGGRERLPALLRTRQEALKDAKDNPTAAQYERGRIALWLTGFEATGQEGPPGLIMAVLGQELGAGLLFAPGPGRRGSPGREGASGSAGGSRGSGSASETGGEPTDPAERRLLLQERIRRLEGENARSQEWTARRNQEIARLRAELQELGEGPAEAPAPPQP